MSRLPAGDFSAWLREARQVLLTGGGSEVPCGDCIGCCSSSYFIHVRPHESAARDRIPKGILFAAPGQPRGHMLLGYDEHGCCPMLADATCTIYAHRPQTCRAYDCRIFAAAGIAPGGADKAVINERVGRWEFSYPTAQDRNEHRAVQAAAGFLRERADCFPGKRVPDNPSELAILALKAYPVFLDTAATAPGPAVAQAIIQACRDFDARATAST